MTASKRLSPKPSSTDLDTQGLGRRRGHVTAQLRDRWTASLMDRVREQNDVAVRARVHPHRGSGEAGVAEAADRKDQPSRLGKVRIDIPAKPKQVLSLDRRIVRGEQRICRVRGRCDGFSGRIVRLVYLLRRLSGLL